MKIIKSVAVILSIFCIVFLTQAQGFVNLNFESAQLSAYGAGGLVPATNAIPNWTAYIGGAPQTNVLYNSITGAAPDVILEGTNNGYFPKVQGNYFLMLWGEFNPLQNTTHTNSAAIGQTGQIPLSAQSISFWGTIGGMQATFNGQPIDFIVTGSTANYTIYSADISAYAGQTGQLLFNDPYYGGTFGGPATIDNIQFSSTAVPEPSVFALAALGGLLLGFRRWRK